MSGPLPIIAERGASLYSVILPRPELFVGVLELRPFAFDAFAHSLASRRVDQLEPSLDSFEISFSEQSPAGNLFRGHPELVV